MKLAYYALFSLACLGPAWSQIAQSHPEYCGISGGLNPPLQGISATIDPTDGHAVLYLGEGSQAHEVRLPDYWISEISEICPLSDGRLVVFANFGGTDVYIVDRAKGTVMDWFRAYFPVMSPDQRSIVFLKFYPLHGVEATDELLAYDLTKTAAENRLIPNGPSAEEAGRLIYPPGQNSLPYDNVGIPRDQTHHLGPSFQWAPDSSALVFIDQPASGPRQLVLVTVDAAGVPAAFEHQITVSDMCGRDIPAEPLDWRLERATIHGNGSGSRSISLDISATGNPSCSPHVLQLDSKNDFQPVKPELHVTVEPTHGQIREGYPAIPPKNK
jgi:hypothetical protein